MLEEVLCALVLGVTLLTLVSDAASLFNDTSLGIDTCQLKIYTLSHTGAHCTANNVKR